MATGSPEFKQQLVQMVRSGIQPVIETIARETSERSIQQATANLSQGGGPAESRATVALIVGIIAILVSGAAIVGAILKWF